MTSEIKVAALQGKSPNFKINLANDTTLKMESDLRLQNQSYLPVPGGDPEANVFARPQNPDYGSLFMNTRTGKLEYWKHGGKGGWGYIVSSGAAGEDGDQGEFLYPWETGSSFVFTSAGRGGSSNTYIAPDINTVRSHSSYNGSNAWENEYLTTPQYDGVMQWTVPGTGVWEFEVAGARGGQSSGYGGYRSYGWGYTVAGDFTFNGGDKVMIVVGQTGQNSQNGGGGGGSFVYVNRNDSYPLLAGGGGGGAGYNSGNGYDATSSSTAGGSPQCGTSGGSNGNSGGDAYGNGGGGGGWNSFGNTGGTGGNTSNFRGKSASYYGGFGMGGGAQGGDNGGGGGGGYSGGGSGCDGGNGWGGGGGGSYIWTGSSAYAGQSQNKGVNGSSQGGGTGYGYVKVTLKSV